MPLISLRLQGWPHSVHTVAFKADGTFYVDLHNFDPDYGPGDYAWTVYVLPDAVPGLKSKVEQQEGRPLSQEQFLNKLVERFTNSSDLAKWLEAEGVPSVRRDDPFAALDADSGP
jgi:hypothetical protein